VNNSIADSLQSFINQINVFKNACTHKLRPFSNFCKVVSWCHSSYRACASSVPRNNCGCSWSSGSISGGRADSCQNYGFVDPYGRANTVGENSVVGAAATPKPYWSNMAEPFTGGAARTSSFTCDNVGGLPTSLQAPIHIFPVLPLLHMVAIITCYFACACAYRSVQENLYSMDN